MVKKLAVPKCRGNNIMNAFLEVLDLSDFNSEVS